MTYQIDLIDHKTGAVTPGGITVLRPSEWANRQPAPDTPRDNESDNEYFIGHHSAWTLARDVESLKFAGNQIVDLHMLDNGWKFAAYNWGFSAVPNVVLEMRGHGLQSGATAGFNTRSAAVVAMGDFRTDEFTDNMKDMFVSLYWEHVREHGIVALGACNECWNVESAMLRKGVHRQFNATDCPSDVIASFFTGQFPTPQRDLPPPPAGGGFQLPDHVKIPIANAAVIAESLRIAEATAKKLSTGWFWPPGNRSEASALVTRLTAFREYWSESVKAGQDL